MEKDLGFDGIRQEMKDIISEIVRDAVSDAYSEGAKKGAKEGAKKISKELENTKVQLGTLKAEIEDVSVEVNDANVQQKLTSAIEKAANTKPVKIKTKTQVDTYIDSSSLKGQVNEQLDEVGKILEKAMSTHKTKWKGFNLLNELKPEDLNVDDLEKKLEKLFDVNNKTYGSEKWNKQFVTAYSAYKTLGGKEIKDYEAVINDLINVTDIRDQDSISVSERNNVDFLKTVINTTKELIPLLQVANSETEKLQKSTSKTPTSLKSGKTTGVSTGATLTEESSSENEDLKERISLLKEIASSYDKVILIEDQMNETNEGTKKYENLEASLESAEEKVKDFESTYSQAILYLNDGSKINIPLDEEFSDTVNNILNDVSKIKDIKMITPDVQKAIDGYEALEKILDRNIAKAGNASGTIKAGDVRTTTRAFNDIKNCEEEIGYLQTAIENIKSQDPSGMFGDLSRLEQAENLLAKLSDRLVELKGETSTSALPLAEETPNTDLQTKTLEELVQLYHQLGTSNGADEELQKVSEAILNIVSAEKKLNVGEMQKLVTILKGLTFVEGDNPILKKPYTVDEAINSLYKLSGKSSPTVKANQQESESSTEATDVVVANEKKKQDAYKKTAEEKAEQAKKSAQAEIDAINNDEEKTLDQKIKKLEGKITTGNKAISEGKRTSDDWKQKIPLYEKALRLLKEQKAEEIRISEEKKKQAKEQLEINKLKREYESDNYVINQTGKVGDDNGWAYTEQFGTSQTQRVSYKYNDDLGEYVETRAPEYTNFKGLTSAFKQGYETLKQMEYQLKKNKDLYGDAYDSSALDKLISKQREYVNQLLAEGREYGKNSDYVMEYRQFVEDAKDAISTSNYKYQNKQNVDKAKEDRSPAYKSASNTLIKLDELKKKLQNSNIDVSEYDDLINKTGKITKLEKECNDIKTNNKSLTKQEITDLQEKEKLIENEIKARIEANKIATQLTASSQEDAKRDYSLKIDGFIEKLKEAKFDTEKLRKEAENLKTTLASVSDKKGMTDIIAKFKTLGYNFDYENKKYKTNTNKYNGLYSTIEDYQKAQTSLNKLYQQQAKNGTSDELTAKIDAQKKKIAELKQEAKDAALAIIEMFKSGSISDEQKTKAVHLLRNVNTGKDESTSLLSGVLNDRAKEHSDEINNVSKQYEKLGYTVEEIIKKLKDLNDAQTEVENVSNSSVQDRLEKELKYQEELDKLQTEAAQMKAGVKPNDASGVINALNNTKQLMAQFANINVNGFDRVFANAQSKVNELNKSLQTGKISTETYTKKIQDIANNLNNVVGVVDPNNITQAEVAMKQYVSMFKNAEIKKFDDETSRLTFTYEKQKGIIKEVTLQYDQMTGAISKVKETTTTAQTGIQSFLSSLKSRGRALVQYLMTFASFYRVIAIVREGITIIRDLDTALTEMRKVSDESVSSLKEFQKVSFDIAGTVGTTAKQIQNSTADWMRLGESLDEAQKSAKVANILLNVSEFSSIDEATESLVSMSAAYDELEKMDIIDKLNEVGNNYSISTNGLAVALQKSASALKTAGNDMNEAVALITAGNAVVQDADSVGTGMQTIALRLTGTKEASDQLEELGEDTDGVITTVSKLRDTILSATRVAANGFKGFDILDENGNYKSTYEIMLGLSEIYKDIEETDKKMGSNNLNLLLETLAGKRRANIAASILQNPEMLKSVYDSSANAEGSAEEELNKYLDSIEGKIAQFQNEVQEFWYNLISSDTVKGIINIGTKVIDIIGKITDKIGLLGTAIVGFAGFKSIKNLVSGNKSGGRTKIYIL